MDTLFKQTEEHKFRIKKLETAEEKNITKLNELVQTDDRIVGHINLIDGKITALNEYREKLSTFKHLEQVDNMWEDIEAHTFCLSKLNKQNENLDIAIQKNKEDVEAKIQETNNVIESLTKKIKYMYLIAGGAAGLAIIELVLLLI